MMSTVAKKKMLSAILLCTLSLAVFCSCGTKEQNTEKEEAAVSSDAGAAQEEKTPTEGSEAAPEARSLSAEELAQWTKYVNNWSNNGFLQSFYSRPEEIDLNELFYSGCGLDQQELTPKEQEAYLELMDMEEIYTEVIRITGEQIEEVLNQRLGLSMKDMEKPLEWCYLADTDAYVVQHGDTNAQNFTCVAGVQQGNQVVLDCVSEMTEQTCRVTLRASETQEGIWMFVSNEELSEEPAGEGQKGETGGDSVKEAALAIEDIFISDEAYMDAVSRLGEEYAQQLRTFAENCAQWLPEEWEMSPGVISFAVYDLDGDGHLELMCTQVQGTGLYACNSFYQADVENGQVDELEQLVGDIEGNTDGTLPAGSEGLGLEIGNAAQEQEGQTKAYIDQKGRIYHMASDYTRGGTQSAACTSGAYFLEKGTVVSLAIRSYTTEQDEQEEWTDTYYLPDSEEPVSQAEWESAYDAFLKGKTAVDTHIHWEDLYAEELAGMKVPGWFLLLENSLEQAVLPVR